MITIKELFTRKELKQFVAFPFSLYKGNPYWVPPIIKDELDTLDKNENPAFEHAEARFFIALKNEKIVGRVAAIINKYETKKQRILKIRFGWFAVIDDLEVSRLLLDIVKEIRFQYNLAYIEGPVGF